jgi:hypothetical protein
MSGKSFEARYLGLDLAIVAGIRHAPPAQQCIDAMKPVRQPIISRIDHHVRRPSCVRPSATTLESGDARIVDHDLG